MKTLLLNLPNRQKVVRRYMCSINATNYLFPPQELMSLGAIAREKERKKEGTGEVMEGEGTRGWREEGGNGDKGDVLLLDAIAENLDFEGAGERIAEFKPDLIVALTGFECFQNDIDEAQSVKRAFPGARLALIGYYPTLFPKELLHNSNADFILLNEPDETFSELYDALDKGKKGKGLEGRGKGGRLSTIQGLAYKEGRKVVVNRERQRIKNLDSLPLPAHELLKNELYFEPFLGKPYSTIQSSRGCPYRCTYCVCTYGHAISFRSAENILAEMRKLNELGIRHFRFVDDTFTIDRKRVIGICNKMTGENLKMKWSCLSRVDALDAEMLKAMKKAGCVRIFLGIESGSQKMLDYYRKGYDAGKIKEKVDLVRKAGIEALGFFIVGTPNETDEDLGKSIELAKKCNFDYVVASSLIPYPGTEMFEQLKKNIDFSLMPYRNKFADNAIDLKGRRMEQRFYREFYLRPGYAIRKIPFFARRPAEAFHNLRKLLGFIFHVEQKDRQDLF